MKVICPNCKSDILNKDINVNTDIAYCDDCTHIFKLSDLLNSETYEQQNSNLSEIEKKTDKKNDISDLYNVSESIELAKPIPLPKYQKENRRDDIDLNQPPIGIKIEQFKDGFEIISTTRSPIAFFLIPFTLVWGGGSMSGIYGSQIFTGKFDLFMSIFGLPFLFGTIFLTALTLMFAIGKVRVTVKGDEGIIFTGIGSTGIQKFFKVSSISSVREETYSNHKSNGGSIIIEGNQRLKFGTNLSTERRYFFVKALKKLMNI